MLTGMKKKQAHRQAKQAQLVLRRMDLSTDSVLRIWKLVTQLRQQKGTDQKMTIDPETKHSVLCLC